ncbi:sigma-54-dependent Fis family transcriptional regulator [Aeromicrobium sp.]|uniref:sigma-54-dependent Fis family transcriptional regulator n=1 Tax=Aeromicrobium sp. TaxID=1871063 RepID=UPI002FC7E1BF
MAMGTDADRIQRAKEQVLGLLQAETPHDAELYRSWQRSQAAIGVPGNVTDVPQVAEELLDAHLLDMFQAPLARFSDSLDGTGLAVLLADSDGQILQRWCSDRSSERHHDRIGTMRGAVLAEDVVGTNGVGTVAATGHSVQIQGIEHFADLYRDAVCTGGAVKHPITGKLLAVVTLSCNLTPRADLLWPLLRSVTDRLEQHVLDIEKPASRQAFNAFLELSRSQPDPVVAFGPDGLLIQNQQAGRLSSADVSQIQHLCQDNVRSGKYAIQLSTGSVDLQVTALESGNNVVVVLEQEQTVRTPVSGSVRSTLSQPGLIGRSPEWLTALQQVSRHRGSKTPLIIAGEAGVGKLSVALGRPHRAGETSSVVVDAAERHLAGGQEWLQRVSDLLSKGSAITIRGIETLDIPVLDGLRALLEGSPGRGAVFMTLTAGSREDAAAFALRYGAQTVWLPPLRERAGDLPSLWHILAKQLAPEARLTLRDETVDVLRTYRWPGNLKELRTVISQLAVAGKTGAVAPADLPASMQSAKSLSVIERVELDAIRNALREADGNRARAAEILGISRATVYRKMKAYRITL